jgi:ubiquinone/menaquinone biosynthesis C-methylase UbiE
MFKCLKTRSFSEEKERMDELGAHSKELEEHLAILAKMNRFFGGYGPNQFLFSIWNKEGFPKTIFDCATGAGDHPLWWIQHAPAKLDFTLGDRHPVTLGFAKKRTQKDVRSFSLLDARKLPFADNSFDACTCQLMLHHFSEEDAAQILRELTRVSKKWVMVSDIRRCSSLYLGTWLLTHTWMREPMTQNDALLSVERAFNEDEFKKIAQKAGWDSFIYKKLRGWRQAMIFKKFEN